MSDTTSTADERKPLSLDIVFDEVKAQLESQTAQASALDGKASFVLASASLLTAGATGLQGAIERQKQIAAPLPVHALEFVTVVVYLAVVFAAWKAYGVRTYHRAPEPNALRKDYLFRDPEFTKRRLIATMANCYSRDLDTINNKVRWTKAALIALGIEGVCLALLTLVQVVI